MTNSEFRNNPTDTLKETGLLFEINRQVLHPFGLSLILLPGSDDKNHAEFMVMQTPDAEGMLYDADSFTLGTEKLNAYLEDFGIGRMHQRKETLGYAVQDHPDPYIYKNGFAITTDNGKSGDDHAVIQFFVPYDWAKQAFREWYGWTVSEFLEHHTHEASRPILEEAREAGVILHEHVLDAPSKKE